MAELLSLNMVRNYLGAYLVTSVYLIWGHLVTKRIILLTLNSCHNRRVIVMDEYHDEFFILHNMLLVCKYGPISALKLQKSSHATNTSASVNVRPVCMYREPAEAGSGQKHCLVHRQRLPASAKENNVRGSERKPWTAGVTCREMACTTEVAR